MSGTRPVQLGFAAVDDRSVGPMPESVIAGDNSTVIAAIADVYLTGSVLDVTYGKGNWWRRFQPEPFAAHDLATDGVDFRALPHAAASWDAVCFDPPYIPSRAPETTSKLRGTFRENYGIDTPRTAAELERLVLDGLAECARVSRRWVLAKCIDYAENPSRFVLGHVALIGEGQRLGLRVHDLIVHANGKGPGGGRIRTVVRARRAHSYLVVFAWPASARRTSMDGYRPSPESACLGLPGSDQ